MNLRVSAGLGRLDLIDGFFSAGGDLLPRAGAARGYVAPHAGFPESTPGNSKEEILADALVYAAVSGRLEAVDLLPDRGADPTAVPIRTRRRTRRPPSSRRSARVGETWPIASSSAART
jgi:hypothetical protein